MKLTTEYLIIIERKCSEAFYNLCDNSNDFEKLLQKDSEVKIAAGKIRYKDKFEFGYEITGGTVEGKEQRFFQIIVTFNGDEHEIDDYSDLLKSVRGLCYRAGGQQETLRDDVSFYYACKSYPLIHKVENVMRKLISYFMITNVGREWVVEASPRSVIEALDKSKRKQYVDALYQIDFNHLGDFLFKPYATRNPLQLYEMIEDARELRDLDLSELKEFKAKSNWERYFSRVVACDDGYLDKRWTELYELRCMIAHNAIITKTDYERIIQLVGEVSEQLRSAINNIARVHVPPEEKERIAESVASNINALSGRFIELWKEFQASLGKLFDGGEDSIRGRTTISILNELYSKELIENDQLIEAKELIHFRNRLVHDASVEFNEQEIAGNINRLTTLLRSIRGSWIDEITNALQMLGGKGTLAEIYSHIVMNTRRTLPESWQANIRNALQTHSSDTESYKGRQDLFRRLDRGYWALRD